MASGLAFLAVETWKDWRERTDANKMAAPWLESKLRSALRRMGSREEPKCKKQPEFVINLANDLLEEIATAVKYPISHQAIASVLATNGLSLKDKEDLVIQKEALDLFCDALAEAAVVKGEIVRVVQGSSRADIALSNGRESQGRPPIPLPINTCRVELRKWDEELAELFGIGRRWNARRVLNSAWEMKTEEESIGLANAILEAWGGVQLYPLESVNVEALLVSD